MSIKALDNLSKFLLYLEKAKQTAKGNALIIEGVKKPQKIDAIAEQFFRLIGKAKVVISIEVKNALAGRVVIQTGFSDDHWNALMREVALVMQCSNALLKKHEQLANQKPKGIIQRVQSAISRIMTVLGRRTAPSAQTYQKKILQLYEVRFKETERNLQRLPLPKDGQTMILARFKEVEKTVKEALQKGDVTKEMFKGYIQPQRKPAPVIKLPKPAPQAMLSRKKASPKKRVLTPKNNHKQFDRAELFKELIAKRKLRHVTTAERKLKTPTPDPRAFCLQTTLTEMNKKLADSPIDLDQEASWQSF